MTSPVDGPDAQRPGEPASAAGAAARSCHKCGRALDAAASFCGNCGAIVLEDGLDADDDPYIGRVIDNAFRVEERIGVGAMGVVYRATQLSLDKAVALKILRSTFVRDPVVLQRFRREALAASKLRHPNTINVIHFGECFDGAPYIAMEYLGGRDLGQIVAEEFPLEPRRVVSFLVQACLALEEAHGAGIIHRDLKPANIVVSERRGEEFVKVLDFGIAKVAEAGETRSREGSRHDALVGTPAFMSPEQIEGHPVDARSDLFSLGVTMYYLLAGRLPFAGDSAVDVAASILRDEPRPPSRGRLGARVPPELDALCLRMLSKDPAQRCQSAAEFRAALQTAWQLHLERGGDARLGGVIVGTSTDAAERDRLAQSTDLATLHQAPAGLFDELRARGHRPGAGPRAPRNWRFAVAIAIALLLGLLLAVILYTLRGRDAKREPDTNQAQAATIRATPLPTTSKTATATPVPTPDLDPDPKVTDAHPEPPLADTTPELALVDEPPLEPDDDDGDTATVLDDAEHDDAADDHDDLSDDDDDGGAEQPLTAREIKKAERKERRRQSTRLYKKARKIWRTDTKSAIALLEEASELYGGSWQTWELLGDAYTRAARRTDAARAYQKVLALKPDHDRAMVLRKAVEAGGL